MQACDAKIDFVRSRGSRGYRVRASFTTGSVPGLIRNDISDFDRTVKGYLKADPQRVESIRNELKLEGKTAIGISWKSFNASNTLRKVSS